MPRSGATYSLPEAAFTANTLAESAKVNSNLSDIATALTNSVSRDGAGSMSGALNMGTQRITSVANGTALTDAATVIQLHGTPVWLGSLGGTASAATASLTPNLAAYAVGATFRAKIGTTLTNGATLNVNSVGAKKLYVNSPSGTARQVATGDFQAGMIVQMTYDTALDGGSGGFVMQPDAASGGWVQAGAPTAVSGSPAATVDLAIPSWCSMFRVEFHDAAPSGAAAPLCARISEDSGSNYLTGGSDYGGVIAGFRDDGASYNDMPDGRIEISTGLATSQAVDGSITMRRAAGARCRFECGHIDEAGPARVAIFGHAGGGTAAPTNIRFFFPSTSVAVGSTFTMFARA